MTLRPTGKRLFGSVLGTLLAAILFLCSCSHGKGALRFDDLSYPVSTSAFLYGEDYALLQKGKDLEVVGLFHQTTRVWGIGWLGLKDPVVLVGKMWEPWDLSPGKAKRKELGGMLNEGIAKANGQGMINLTVSTSPCWLSITYDILQNIPTVLPFMPGCAVVTVTGEIVRQRPAISPALKMEVSNDVSEQ
jgi:hypothetical protein